MENQSRVDGGCSERERDRATSREAEKERRTEGDERETLEEYFARESPLVLMDHGSRLP